MNWREKMRTTVALTIFAVVFLTLSVASYTRTSATFDEPVHLTTGYMMWKHGDFRFDPEHPPFQPMWDALPLLFMRHIQPVTILPDAVGQYEWVGYWQFEAAHQFLYKANDADHLLYAGRFMTALLGVLLGIFLFSWAREWLGFWPASLALAMYCLEPNILAHGSLVTTDFGVTCFFFGAIYFLWRLSRDLNAKNFAGIAICCALALASKFSAFALAPIIVALLVIRATLPDAWKCGIGRRKELATRRDKFAASALVALLLALISWVALWAAYDFRYRPSSAANSAFRLDERPDIRSKAPTVAAVVHWIDGKKLLPNAYTQGLLLGQSKLDGHLAFFDGKVKAFGWWWFFPAVFAIKTPISLIILLLGGLGLCAWLWRSTGKDAAFVALPPAVFLAAAMCSRLNIGLRHILPVFPFAILLAAFCAAAMLRSKLIMPRVALALCLAFWLFEFFSVYPHNLAFVNEFVGGPSHGYEYLADSNIDWGQDLKGLKKWMDQQGVKHINLAYFGSADPAYYGLDCTYMPGSPIFEDKLITSRPQRPGYLAISNTLLDGVNLSESGRRLYIFLQISEPVAVIGYSIRVYQIR
jgi:hypothetical protein